MSKFIINGERQLSGELNILGAKNSVLPLLAAAILTDEKVVLHNCPDISDVHNMLAILQSLGSVTTFDKGDITIDSSNINNEVVPSKLAHELRSSIFLLGSILSKFNKATLSYPGGCEIGERPIDIHLKGLRELGVNITEESGQIYCKNSKKISTTEIVLDIPSVGATENLMMASVFADGIVTLRNVAREPEIVDLQNFLNSMGAKIYGAGCGVIVVHGVKKLYGVEYTPIGDRIVAGTYMIGAAMCGGDITLKGINCEYLSALVSKLSKTTCNIYANNDIIRIKSKGRHPRLGKIDTMYYPGFPTDLQSQMSALGAVADGISIITENIFETRFKQIPEFRKMGAIVDIKGRTAIFEGVPKLYGAEVKAEDLRGGASLVLMGLFASGTTVVHDIKHIDRGYQSMELDIQSLGGDIVRVN